jgi:hypothetical protein
VPTVNPPVPSTLMPLPPSPGGTATGGPEAGTACRTSQLSARLGTPELTGDHARAVPLVYTNTSDRTCTLHGSPDVTLHGPGTDPNGPDFELTPRDTGAGPVTLATGGPRPA